MAAPSPLSDDQISAMKEDAKSAISANIDYLLTDGRDDLGGTTGMENIAEDLNAPAEYFNLQGIRVERPMAGQVYIVRRGASASKVKM